MRTSDFDYDLPAEYIAQTPLEQRDLSRLLILDRHTGDFRHAIFRDIGNYLRQGDILVLNETRVIPARLFARKVPSGGKVEILLLRKRDEHTWEALVGGKGLTVGKQLKVSALVPEDKTPTGEIIEDLSGSERLIQFDQELEPFFSIIGHVPLPPYIHTTLQDPERYQTVYANNPGSAAAPTAGLHFTPELITQLIGKGIQFTNVTLHVGMDTFAPVNEGNPKEHRMHTEWCQLMPETAEVINQASKEGGRVIAVGTTSVRTLESAAANGKLTAFEGPTDLFILPGYKFQVVDGLITNFHLPRSTLIMMVSALAGRENILNAYEVAKQANYRFYSFGDAMLII
ncbi:MAG: tRNA preQ1(34) S-adenosylmethionine ribosyltransferase-isomerase QueA [Chloroflexi bacterium RBG_19FT_COMBO_47_9]|nr:MAG: tRNA preQ1(34) S-adenosylmethionine ribosyltransferase-isomerase QueA [Chloroflexi bacterium RBG_19FT_COMBO_47_9]